MFSFFGSKYEGTNTLTKNTCDQLIRNLIKKDLKKRENLIALSSTNMPKNILENLAENFENVTMTEGLVPRQRDKCFSYFNKYMKPKLVKIFEEERQKLFASNTRNKTRNNRNNRKREKKSRVRFNNKVSVKVFNSNNNSGISNNNSGISNNNSTNNKPVNNYAAMEERRKAAKARRNAWEKSYAEKQKGGKRSKLTKRRRQNVSKKSAKRQRKTRKLRK